MKQWILFSLAFAILPLGAAQNQREVIDCNIIFEQRKAEIIKEIERIDEQQQALQALQSATQNVLDQKEADLKKREIALNNAQKEMEEREAKIARLLKRNEEILKQIRGATQSKVGETYAGMKDSKSAAILESLPDAEAAEILYALDTKVMSKILSKMTPQKAATLTQLLQKGPPFEEEKESPQPKNANPQDKENNGNAI